MGGMLITFEGIDASGKSTHIDIFREKLEKDGYNAVLLREPGGTEIGESIRNILLDRNNTKMCMEAELLLFLASRAQIVRETIRPAINEGKIVLCDRYIDSSVAYQGYARGLGKDTVDVLNKFAIGDTVPDITFYFDIEPEKAIERINAREQKQDRIDVQGVEFLTKVRNGYKELAKDLNKRIKVLDADKKIQELSGEIYNIFKEENK